jgi:hypothetical protein
MKAAKHILAIAGFILTAGFCQAQAVNPDSTSATTTTDTVATLAVVKAPLYDTGQANTYCPTCANTGVKVNNDHVVPYYKENKPYADPARTANMKPGVLSQDGGRPSINGAHIGHGILLQRHTPVR